MKTPVFHFVPVLCLWFCHWASLKRVCLCLLYIPPSDFYTDLLNITYIFINIICIVLNSLYRFIMHLCSFEPSLLWPEPSQLSQVFLIREMLQSLHQSLWRLDTPHYAHVPPGTCTVLQCPLTDAEETGGTISLELLAILCLSHRRSLLVLQGHAAGHVHLGVHQEPQVFFCTAAL